MIDHDQADPSAALLHRIAELIANTVVERFADAQPPPATARRLLTVEEAAESLTVSRTIIYELIRSGELESVSIGRLRRVPVDAVDKFVTRLREEQNAPST
ncbi:helix-turn-helix domain-containing protein [Amycolatopsis regifaucium]|uniref:Helix-turn-helix domain-containing protein n=1 Tax=Amycolatopsis regifaucium TaxID=546365 RepID=A0ABX3DFX4_9PSEU|nr:helix-turn-helix domain-containing protein [Amycolatopsis regifaucium]OKA03355.1 hypothetical protein ATP06_0236740 [Amycolatopsis regifaucium]